MQDKQTREQNRNRILLEETFYVLTKKNSVFRVRLAETGLYLIKESETNTKEQMIPIKDIIGCRCLRSKKQTTSCACQSGVSSLKVVEENSGEQDDTDVSAYLYIYAYILQKTKSLSYKRERTIITLRFRSFDKYEDNHKEAQRWRTLIKKLINGEDVSGAHIADLTSMEKLKEQRRLLILLNPKSGKGKARALFQQKVAPILQEAEIPFDLHITKHANYARAFIRTCNIFMWTGIVLVGGDGIMFEVINGMFERWDWSECTQKIPIGIIPAGSGNGLARSIAYLASEPFLPNPTLPATIAAVRNYHAPMDLVRVETTSQIMFSFLSVGWGLLSDIDIESERLRLLGAQRFTIWSVAKLIGLRSYGGTLWYLPVSAPLNSAAAAAAPSPAKVSESNVDLPPEVHLETDSGRQRLDSWYSAASRRSTYFSTTGSSYQSTADSAAGDAGIAAERSRMYGPASQLPCITAPLLPNWSCLRGRFIMVHASYQTHLGEECFFAPAATLNDGTIWLLVVKAGATRAQVLHFLLGLSSAAHAQNCSSGGHIELLAVRAFRIEPDLNESGCMTVDGELVEYGPIQAEVFAGLTRVMVP